MSVSLLEVIESGGYNLENIEDCYWLVSREDEFEELIKNAIDKIDSYEEERYEE